MQGALWLFCAGGVLSPWSRDVKAGRLGVVLL